VIRSAFTQAYYPLSRFRRIEAGLRLANVDDAILSVLERYDPRTGFLVADPVLVTSSLPGINFAQPSAALVFDNTFFGYVAPLQGRRYRLEVAQTVGDWRFTQATVDYRRYDPLPGPFTLATRLLYFGRIGRDAEQFRFFAGSTDLIRGHT